MKKPGLLTQVLIAFFLAIVAGILFGPSVKFIQPLGDLFLRLIKFIVVPLVLSSLVVGITSLRDSKKLLSLGGKTITYFLLTTLCAISIGLVTAWIIAPGKGVNIEAGEGNAESAAEVPSLIDTLLNIVPVNPFESLANGEILQVIFLAVVLGIAITVAGEKAEPVRLFFDSLAQIMYRITGAFMKLAPLGIFGILAPVVGQHGLSVLLPLLKIIVTVAVACLLHISLVYFSAVKWGGKIHPLDFIKGIAPAGLIAFTTASSSATLPVAIRNTRENLHVSKEVSSFVLPLGSTINMDGAAIYQGVAVFFIAQFYGVDLSLAQILTVIGVAILASIGAAGVPGAGLIMLTMVLSSVNLPLEGIGLVAAVDRILDMFRTSTNVIGDVSAAVVIEESEKKKRIVEQKKKRFISA